MSFNPYRWITIPGVSYPKPNKATPEAPAPQTPAKKTPRKSRRLYEHPLYKENPTLYTKYGVRRKVPLTPKPSELEWCTAKEAMAILSCSRATVDVVAAKHAIPTQKHSNVRPCGNGATAFMYFRRDDVIMAAKLRAIKKNKSRKK